MKKISIEEYLEATDQYLGWCTICEKFTREQTEPDAEGYDCPECCNNSVIGAEDALIAEQFSIKE